MAAIVFPSRYGSLVELSGKKKGISIVCCDFSVYFSVRKKN